MEHQSTREEFYDLIWSKPIKDLALEFGISDVALGKICRQIGMAMPGRGHWAKLKAGAKLPARPKLPQRNFGEHDTVTIGDKPHEARRERLLLLEELPPKPTFSETLPELAERAKAAVGHVAFPKTLAKPHRIIARLLQRDDARREKSGGVVGWTAAAVSTLAQPSGAVEVGSSKRGLQCFLCLGLQPIR